MAPAPSRKPATVRLSELLPLSRLPLPVLGPRMIQDHPAISWSADERPWKHVHPSFHCAMSSKLLAGSGDQGVGIFGGRCSACCWWRFWVTAVHTAAATSQTRGPTFSNTLSVCRCVGRGVTSSWTRAAAAGPRPPSLRGAADRLRGSGRDPGHGGSSSGTWSRAHQRRLSNKGRPQRTVQGRGLWASGWWPHRACSHRDSRVRHVRGHRRGPRLGGALTSTAEPAGGRRPVLQRGRHPAQWVAEWMPGGSRPGKGQEVSPPHGQARPRDPTFPLEGQPRRAGEACPFSPGDKSDTWDAEQGEAPSAQGPKYLRPSERSPRSNQPERAQVVRQTRESGQHPLD